MTTNTFAGTYAHANDANFQAWATTYYGVLEAMLTQVPQTGELAYPVVAVRPGALAYAGFRIYKLNDSLGTSNPIYIRVRVGTAGATTVPQIEVSAGTGVDGAGNLTGAVTATFRGSSTTNSASYNFPAGSRSSYACAVDGAFWFMFCEGNTQVGAMSTWGVFRSTDTAGAPTATGFHLFHGRGDAANGIAINGNLQCVKMSPATVYGNATTYSIAPGPISRVSSGGLGGAIEAYLCFYLDPLSKPSSFMSTIWNGEFSMGTTFSAALVGSTSRTYISVNDQAGRGDASLATKPIGHAFVWE
jgi:hypothetical protein